MISVFYFWSYLIMAVNFPSREIIKSLRTEFPVGARVEILKMNDVQAPPMGTLGTVTGIDHIGTMDS